MRSSLENLHPMARLSSASLPDLTGPRVLPAVATVGMLIALFAAGILAWVH